MSETIPTHRLQTGARLLRWWTGVLVVLFLWYLFGGSQADGLSFLDVFKSHASNFIISGALIVAVMAFAVIAVPPAGVKRASLSDAALSRYIFHPMYRWLFVAICVLAITLNLTYDVLGYNDIHLLFGYSFRQQNTVDPIDALFGCISVFISVIIYHYATTKK